MTYLINIEDIITALSILTFLALMGFGFYWAEKELKKERDSFKRERQDYINQICSAILSLRPDNSTNLDCIADTLVDIADSANVLKEYIEMEIVTDAKQEL